MNETALSPDQSAPASRYATALLEALIARGVRDVVVCPGSRSQALALAAAQAEAVGAIRLHVRLDERSAAFFALGVARETGLPAPVIVTSGSAVANLVPAALEAHEARVPMLFLTADRPASMRGTRSNQTTRQSELFQSFGRLTLDIDVDEALRAPAGTSSVHDAETVATRALAEATGRFGADAAGPVQLNLQFREPLSSPESTLTPTAGSRFEMASRQWELGGLEGPHTQQKNELLPQHTLAGGECYEHADDALTVVIAGADAGLEAEAFAHEAGLPLLAEVVSGARFGREAISAYATLIDDPQIGGLVERAVVFGHPTLTRQIPALLRRDDVEVVVVDQHRGEKTDHYLPTASARVVLGASVHASYNRTVMHSWLGRWVVADRALREKRTTVHSPDLEAARATGHKERNSYARAELAVAKQQVTRPLLAESVWRASWPHDRLVLSASRLVRVLDGIAAPRRVNVQANRGLAGIDGTIATAMGVAIASQSEEQRSLGAGVTRVLIGDLALLHDAGSMLLPEGEPHPRIQLFVGNDGGGTIFDTLEAAGTAERSEFDRVMYTPQRSNLESLAAAYGWEYRRVTTRAELERLLTEQVSGPQLVEVPLARSE